MNYKNLNGYTLIEMATTLTMASAFSLGLFFIFLSANKIVSNDEIVYDIKSYSTSALDIISDKIRNSDQISICKNCLSNGNFLNSNFDEKIPTSFNL